MGDLIANWQQLFAVDAFGRPLDFVFYRGLSVHDASVLVTRASDHNPLLVEFSPGKPD